MYTIYTLPNCEHCQSAVELMRKRGIEFEQVDVGGSGIAKFKDFYLKHREQIRREPNSSVTLPVVVYEDNGNIRIHQGEDGLEKFLGL